MDLLSEAYRWNSVNERVAKPPHHFLSLISFSCISWPPTGSELTSTLMSAVVETVSDMRSNDARRIALAQEQGLSSNLTGTTIALKDLDERLSFAISRPERKKGDPKNWKDPQCESRSYARLSTFG